jgi:hypothetical protein
MINSVTVTNYRGQTTIFTLRGPFNKGICIADITGLDPVPNTINSVEGPFIQGALYNSVRTGKRNIVITSLLQPSDTIEEARHKLYAVFPPRREVSLVIGTDTRDWYITGYVEAINVGIFSRQEAASVSILCMNPFFNSGANTTVVLGEGTGGFTFPFSNESLTDPLISFGDYVADASELVYNGDVEVGVLFRLIMSGSPTFITLKNQTRNETITIDTDKFTAFVGTPIQSGDIISISTVPGNKFARLVRNGTVKNILNCVSISQWIKLQNGSNIITVTSLTDTSAITTQVIHGTLFEGI